MMTTSSTPPASASSQARSLAIIPAVAVPPFTSSPIAAGSSRPNVFPSPSSTPGVEPAMTRRRARKPRARWPAIVSALTFSNCPSFVMPMLDTTGTMPAASSVCSTRMLDELFGSPTRPSSTDCPPTVLCGGATSEMPQPPSAPVSPAAGTPAAESVATNRVLTTPASTETTTSSVGSSVMRRPSTCRFSMPASFSAASISLPPPCTMTNGVPVAAICAIEATRAFIRDASSSSSPPNFRTTGAVTAARWSGRGRASRSCSARPGPTRP